MGQQRIYVQSNISLFTKSEFRFRPMCMLVIFGMLVFMVLDELDQHSRACADEVLHVARNGEHLIIPVMVGKHEALFAIDTANGITSIDCELEAVLGEKTRTIKEFDGFEFREQNLFRPPPIRVAQLDAKITEVSADDLSLIRRSIGHQVKGVLGMDFLRQQTLTINYDRGEVRLHKSPADAKFATGFRKRCVLTQNPSLAVIYNKLPKARLGDLETFVIDTGLATSLALREEVFDALVQLGVITAVQRQKGASVTTTRDVAIGLLKDFEFAGFKHPSLKCARMKISLIGQGLLSRYQVTMDFPRGEIWLRPGERINAPEAAGLSGIGVERAENGAVIVCEITPESTSEKAGIVLGDELLNINGEDLSNLSLFEVRMKFTQSGDCRLTFRRDGQLRAQVLTLR